LGLSTANRGQWKEVTTFLGTVVKGAELGVTTAIFSILRISGLVASAFASGTVSEGTIVHSTGSLILSL